MKKIMLNQSNIHELALTLDEAYSRFEKYSKSKNLAEETIDTYYRNYIYFCEFLKYHEEHTKEQITKCSQITEDIMIAYIAFMKDEKTIKDVTINTRITHVKAFFMYCFERSYMQYFKIQKIRAQKTIKELYTDTEMDILLTKPDITKCCFEDYRNWVIANFLYATSIRLGSIVEIKIKDISFQTMKIFIGHLKSKKTLFLPLGEELGNILKEYLSHRQRTARRLSILQNKWYAIEKEWVENGNHTIQFTKGSFKNIGAFIPS